MASGRTFLELVAFYRVFAATLDHVIVVTADVHEIPSGVPRRLEELGVSVIRKRLPAGDYIIGDSAVVERKSVLDLQDSLIKSRVWVQIGRLRRMATWPYLLIDGESLAAGPINEEALRGPWLAVTDLGLIVLHRDRPPYAQRFERVRPHPAEAALAAAPGISIKTARLLLERFGSLGEVVAASRDDWQAVSGVGPHRSEALRQMVHDEWHLGNPTSHSDVSRNGCRAT